MPVNTGTAVRELRIGPYAGGINQYSDVSAIADDELFDCINFDLALDGSLVSRPPWSLLYWNNTPSSAGGTSPPPANQLILITGVFENVRFCIFTSNHAVSGGAVYIFYLDGPSAGTAVKIKDGSYSSAIRYADRIFIVPMATTVGATGTGIDYSLATGLVSDVTGMPRGTTCIVYKDRLWITGSLPNVTDSRLYFSDLANFFGWPGTNFFDINPGDGDSLNALIIYQDNLMLFKDNATYALGYDQGPAQAVLQVVNGDVGVYGPMHIVAYENSVFMMKYDQVYEMTNYDFTRISVKLPFEYDATFDSTISGQSWIHPTWMKNCGDRLVCRFFNRIYVYHLRLKAWTRWKSLDQNINGLGPMEWIDATSTNNEQRKGINTYLAVSSYAKNPDSIGPGSSGAWNMFAKLFKFEDTYGATTREDGDSIPSPVDIECRMATKMYDIGVSHRFKRLMHWGVDTISGRTVTGTVIPSAVAYQVTWGQLHPFQWHQLNTWGTPLFINPFEQRAQPLGAAYARVYIRFPKSLRFRLVQFQVDMITQGNKTDGPARLYSLTAFISGKQLVPKGVN